MTQEEKARAYDEALERAMVLRQEAIDKGYALDYIKDYETIFPELAESEDERIRMALIKLMTVAGERYVMSATGFKKERLLAYLEKQKEPHFTKRNALFDKCVENCDPEVMKRVSDEVDGMLEKEQEPEWSEEDEKMYKAIIIALSLNSATSYLRSWGITLDDADSWLKSLRPSWKPSEEQMDALNKARRFIPYNCDILESLYEHLKKL